MMVTDSKTGGSAEPEAVLSPCTGVCVLDISGEYCVSCLRTRTEIAEWTLLSDGERERVMGKLENRARGELL
jgi:predicted Fe-S protein YdhL (DUF1289 family)